MGRGVFNRYFGLAELLLYIVWGTGFWNMKCVGSWILHTLWRVPQKR